MLRSRRWVLRWWLWVAAIGTCAPDAGEGVRASEPFLRATRIASDLDRPVFLASPPGDTQRLFVLEQHTGQIRIIDRVTGEVATTPFLQIPNVSRGNEQGLLGLAFAPDYANSGQFYVNYTDVGGTTRVVGYRASGVNPNLADPASARPILSVRQPQANHNGGWLGFSPNDGYLYIATGDGGASNDSGIGHTPTTGNAQDITSNLLGKMLRIDPTADAFPDDQGRNYSIPTSNPFVDREGDDEIWAYGLRNPWRNSFDRATGDLYLADVGQGQREEVNYQSAQSAGGVNYGWRMREGTIATPEVGGPAPAGSLNPIFEYGRNLGYSVTGGYVYRGPIPELQGQYFVADFGSANLWTMRVDDGVATDVQNQSDRIFASAGQMTNLASFGEDADGNLYAVSLQGSIFRFDDVVYPRPIVRQGSTWSYFDAGTDPGTNWNEPTFDDRAWLSGPAELGYGDGDEATLVSTDDPPGLRAVTVFFRHEFLVDDPKLADQLLLELKRDDGAAVYLNGHEIARTANLSPNATYQSLADHQGEPAISGSEENRFLRFTIPNTWLVEGKNLLAVEMHQQSRASNDLSFDLRFSQLFTDEIVPGDVNADGLVDAHDIDRLAVGLRSGEGPITLDVNQDRLVNQQDYEDWIRNAKGTWRGDSDMNGLFDESDLILVMQGGFYESESETTATWALGDWNADGRFDSSDLLAAFQEGGYLQGTRPQAVPEPSPLAFAIVSATLVASRAYPKKGRTQVRGRMGRP